MFLPQDLFCSSLEQEVKDSSLFATCAAQQTFGVSWAVATLPAGEASAIPREATLNGDVEEKEDKNSEAIESGGTSRVGRGSFACLLLRLASVEVRLAVDDAASVLLPRLRAGGDGEAGELCARVGDYG